MGIFILNVTSMAFNLFYFAMFLYIISSWFPKLRESQFMQVVAKIVEPYLSIFRKIIPPLGMIDLSPIVGIILFRFISDFALNGLRTVLTFIGLL